MAQKNEPPLHAVRINFGGVKRYRKFPFLPRAGERINVTDLGVMFCLDVETVWFDDRYGEDICEVQLDCRIVEEIEVGEGPANAD